MSRPKKTDKDRKSRFMRFRVTAEQELSVRMNAAAAGVTPTEYARRRTVGHTVTPPASRADAALLAEVNRIGVNVNQLAFAWNAGREFKGDWEAIRDELARVIDKVASRYDP